MKQIILLTLCVFAVHTSLAEKDRCLYVCQHTEINCLDQDEYALLRGIIEKYHEGYTAETAEKHAIDLVNLLNRSSGNKQVLIYNLIAEQLFYGPINNIRSFVLLLNKLYFNHIGCIVNYLLCNEIKNKNTLNFKSVRLIDGLLPKCAAKVLLCLSCVDICFILNRLNFNSACLVVFEMKSLCCDNFEQIKNYPRIKCILNFLSKMEYYSALEIIISEFRISSYFIRHNIGSKNMLLAFVNKPLEVILDMLNMFKLKFRESLIKYVEEEFIHNSLSKEGPTKELFDRYEELKSALLNL